MNGVIRQFLKDPPSIETKRLLFRPMRPDDAEDMFEYSRRETVTRYLLWSPHPDVSYTRDYLSCVGEMQIKGRYFDWAAVLKSEKKMIGTAGYAMLDAQNRAGEIGYVLSDDYWHMGLGTEMAKELLSFGFCALGFNRIQARYMIGNDYSRRIMDKCGMTFEGVMREALYVKDRYRDIGICSILARDYFAHNERREYGTKRFFHLFS